jgi:heme O synthase-like polyprenyltransferase
VIDHYLQVSNYIYVNNIWGTIVGAYAAQGGFLAVHDGFNVGDLVCIGNG